MAARIERRAARARNRRRIAFLDPATTIPGTEITVQDARDGKFEGSEIPADLTRQWIQGTGPAARPRAEATTPTATASTITDRSTWPRPAPRARSSAAWRVRWATMIEKVL